MNDALNVSYSPRVVPNDSYTVQIRFYFDFFGLFFGLCLVLTEVAPAGRFFFGGSSDVSSTSSTPRYWFILVMIRFRCQ